MAARRPCDVKISAKTEYACLAMLELAGSYDRGEPVRVRRIAQQHGIPARFLVQILLQLKGAGLVASVRGASGGYRLQKPPHEITLGDIMSVLDGREPLGSYADVASAAATVLMETWQEIADAEQRILERTTLAQLLERASHAGEAMYYI
jgi:Rrf2 family protein